LEGGGLGGFLLFFFFFLSFASLARPSPHIIANYEKHVNKNIFLLVYKPLLMPNVGVCFFLVWIGFL